MNVISSIFASTYATMRQNKKKKYEQYLNINDE